MNLQWSNTTALAWAQLWQVTLLVIVVAILTRLVARNRPHLAYALWLLVLVKCVTPPVFASASGVFCWLQPATHVAIAESAVAPEPVQLAAPPEKLIIPLYPVESVPAPTAAPASIVKVPQARFNWPDWAAGGLVVWAVGASVSLGLSIWRWRGCLRRARRVPCEPDLELAERVSGLARRLRLRRRVRVLVTQGRLGPAVTGVLRPTLLMPEGMLADKTANELEPLLAHELIHIRRGDLWAGLLQTVVLALWWFHPLVRWAVRQAMREAERCCDEAVLAELACKPGDYARSLLGVLQYKMEWAPAPVFPGAGRIDATSKRLERIMRLGQGCRHRSPWWCWVVMGVVGAAVLPGRAFVAPAAGEAVSEAARAEQSPTTPAFTFMEAGTVSQEAINDLRIYDDAARNELAKACLLRHGEEVLEHAIKKLLLMQECRKRGIQISDDEVDTEIRRMASRFKLSVERWLALLERDRGITPVRYTDDIVYPTLALRKIAGDDLTVSEEELRREYEKLYGPSVRARAIACKSLEKAQRLHAAVTANPDDFARIAQNESEDENSLIVNGMLPPIRCHLGYEEIQDAAFALQPGDISPVTRAAGQYVILKCEQRLPGQKVKFDDAIALLEESVRESKLRAAAAQVFEELQKKAETVVVFNDPVKRKENPGVAAFVNGQPISLRELAELCILRYGNEPRPERHEK